MIPKVDAIDGCGVMAQTFTEIGFHAREMM
jgi:hypothetical protein